MNKGLSWPVRYKEMLLLGNPKSNIGVVCNWTLKSKIDNNLKNKNYLVMGQLYSSDIGISSIIRNVMAHQHIDTIILCGNEGMIEETRGGRAFLNIIKNGVDENHKIIGSNYAKIEKEIPVESINEFRKRVNIIDLLGVNDVSKIEEAINGNLKKKTETFEVKLFPEPEKTKDVELPSEGAVFVVRRNKVAHCWLDILKNITNFGNIKGTQYGDRQKEVINLVAVVEDEDVDDPFLPDYVKLTKKQIKDYSPTITTAMSVEGSKYTYGQRLRDHDGVDQIQNIINEISEAPFSRRAVASTINVKIDSGSGNPPCLDIVQVLVQENKLYLTSYIRSNDMYMAWPENAFGLLSLQKLIIEEVNKTIKGEQLVRGSITTISCSAHVYEREWEDVKKMLSSNERLECAWDPRGYFIISIENGLIKVYNSNDPVNLKWEGKTASEIMDKIIFYISIMPHAADLGMELMKAEIALKYGYKYIQDNPLIL